MKAVQAAIAATGGLHNETVQKLSAWRAPRAHLDAVAAAAGPRVRLTWHWDSVLTLLLMGLVGWALWTAQDFKLPSSRFLPVLTAYVLLPLLAVELLRRTMNIGRGGQIMDLGMRAGTGLEAARRLAYVLSWIVAFVVAIGFVSLPYAAIGFAVLFAVVNVHWRGRKRLWALVPAILIATLIYGLFNQVMNVIWPDPIFLDWLFR